jgi:microsomal dipeptidase-like Zn-dependent dipeptidase
LRATGLSDEEVAGIMGDNWHRFYAENFTPMT